MLPKHKPGRSSGATPLTHLTQRGVHIAFRGIDRTHRTTWRRRCRLETRQTGGHFAIYCATGSETGVQQDGHDPARAGAMQATTTRPGINTVASLAGATCCPTRCTRRRLAPGAHAEHGIWGRPKRDRRASDGSVTAARMPVYSREGAPYYPWMQRNNGGYRFPLQHQEVAAWNKRDGDDRGAWMLMISSFGETLDRGIGTPCALCRHFSASVVWRAASRHSSSS